MVWEHKGFKIELSDSTGKFSCKELKIEDKPSLDSVKLAVDTHLKSQLKKGVEAYSYNGGYYGEGRADIVTVTSINETAYGDEFWTKDEKGNRGKSNSLYKKNERNEELFKLIKGLSEEKKKLEKKIESSEKQLQRLTKEDVKGDVNGTAKKRV